MRFSSMTFREMVRYAVVGLTNNSLGYLIYLAFTWAGVEPKLTVTLLYPVGAIMGYFGHARFSFAYNGGFFKGISRYTIAHLAGYGANVGLLYVFHDKMHIPHQLVQVAAIFLVAGLLFVLFKYFVFAGASVERL